MRLAWTRRLLEGGEGETMGLEFTRGSIVRTAAVPGALGRMVRGVCRRRAAATASTHAVRNAAADCSIIIERVGGALCNLAAADFKTSSRAGG